MARLTYDAVLLLARIGPHEVVTVTDIAIKVFSGYNPENPQQPTKGALIRAQRAAQNLAAMRRIAVSREGRDIHSLRVIDLSGGSLQAQMLMNIMVRGGDERRKNDRRAEVHPEGDERRKGDRRAAPEGKTAPPRIIRTPPKKPVAPPSPFDIKKDFKL